MLDPWINVVKTRIKKDKRTYESNSCWSRHVKDIVTSSVYFTDQPTNITWGLIWDPPYLEDSHNMESLIDSMFRFLDKERDVELEISKLILEQGRNKWSEIPNYDEIDQEISILIQGFEEEERQ